MKTLFLAAAFSMLTLFSFGKDADTKTTKETTAKSKVEIAKPGKWNTGTGGSVFVHYPGCLHDGVKITCATHAQALAVAAALLKYCDDTVVSQ